jgi:diguanylate cyclase (GGDEF)-like protein
VNLREDQNTAELPAEALLLTGRYARFGNLLTWLIISILVMLTAFMAVYARQSWNEIVSNEATELQNVAVLGSQTADLYFSKITASVNVLGTEVEKLKPNESQNGIQSLLDGYHNTHKELKNITILNERGGIEYSTVRIANKALLSAKDSPSFQEFIKQPLSKETTVGRPVNNVVVGGWTIPVRYSYVDHNSQKRFMLVAHLSVEFMENYWVQAPISKFATIGIIRDDGYVISRYPSQVKAGINSLYEKPRTGALITEIRARNFPLSGYIEGASSLDPTSLLQSYRRLEHFPMTLFVTVNVATLRQMWWDKVRVPLLLFILILLGSLVVYVWTFRLQKQWGIEQIRISDNSLKLAYFDSLTGLPNRLLLKDRLNHNLLTSKRTGYSTAIMFLDLDNFKSINDARGHAVGDEVLKAVSLRIKEVLREEDTFARIGGDEFVIVTELRTTDGQNANQIALQLANKVHLSLSQPLNVIDQPYTISASIGISIAPPDVGTVGDLLREADTAMYQAKAGGRGRVSFFQAAMKEAVEVRLALEEDLGRAIDRGELSLHIQSQVNFEGNKVGAEVLMRWNHPERGSVPPSVFIALAEQSDLINTIGDWLLTKSCELCVQISTLGYSLPISINISPKQFRQIDFAEKVRDALKVNGLVGSCLVFEVTEGLLIQDLEGAIERMNSLAEMGIRFSIDDFGTGYSSLSYLQRLPLYELKIDKSFVHRISKNANDRAIVELIIAMAQHLDLKVVAEGVETLEQAQMLQGYGCETFQGYLYGKPSAIEQWLTTM